MIFTRRFGALAARPTFPHVREAATEPSQATETTKATVDPSVAAELEPDHVGDATAA